MEKNLYKRALTEVYYVLQNSNKEIKDKIPKKFMKFIIDNMERKYIPIIQFNSPNWDDYILSETKEVLAIIYRDYIVR